MPILPEMDHRKIYTGSKINAQYLQALLLESSIKSVVRDDGESARRAGFGMDYMNEGKLLVHKDDYLKAKHIIDSVSDENGNLKEVDEELLAEQAMEERPMTTKRVSPKEKYTRSKGNIIINGLIAAYAAFRLYPVLQGAELPLWRIAMLVALLGFCGWTVVSYFISKPKAE